MAMCPAVPKPRGFGEGLQGGEEIGWRGSERLLDTIPTLAWCNLPDGSNDFVNQRWSDYTGLSQEEVKRGRCKVAIHPEDLPKCWSSGGRY